MRMMCSAWLRPNFDREIVAYGLLMTVALALRLVELPDRAFHHDESQHAYFAWVFFDTGRYAYDPLLHGPVRDFATALMYLLFGVSDFSARLAPALLGTAIVGLPYFLRQQIGGLAAFATATLLSFSPAYLYYSRFQREDIYVAFVTLAMTVVVFRFLEQPRRWHPPLVLGLLAVSFAIKETTYITVFVAGTFFLAVAARQLGRARRAGRRATDASLIRSVRSVSADAWAWGAITFLAVFTVLFTTFFLNPKGLQDGLFESLRYWLGQQPVGRGGQPWFYYLVVLGGYEWLALTLGAVGIAVSLRRPTLLRAYLIWAFLLSLAVYSWASERMPWLTLHVLLPLLLLAGIGLQAAWQARGRVAGRCALVAVAVAAAYTAHANYQATYRHPTDPAELLVFTQASNKVLAVHERLLALDRRQQRRLGRHITLDYDRWGGLDWPWAWYLHEAPKGTVIDMSLPGYVPKADAVLVGDPQRSRLLPLLRHYRGHRFHYRVWWVPAYSELTPRKAWRWLVWRRPWNPRGTLDEWLYLRRGL